MMMHDQLAGATIPGMRSRPGSVNSVLSVSGTSTASLHVQAFQLFSFGNHQVRDLQETAKHSQPEREDS